MSATFFDLMKYAATGRAAPSMTDFDKMRAMSGGEAVRSITGVPPLSFTGNGKPLVSWSILSNVSQTGTPTPDAPIQPTFCGKLVGNDWTIPISCAGQTTPVYLGQVSTVRRVKKLVLTGEERFSEPGTYPGGYLYMFLPSDTPGGNGTMAVSTHYKQAYNNNGQNVYIQSGRIVIIDATHSTAADFKAYLAAQYAAGTPVTVWYVLATPETGIVNEPLAKIGDYADELHSTDAGVTIPTVNGDNVLTVDTELKPSSLTITGYISQ